MSRRISESYPLSQRVVPFIKGLGTFSPLVEVALAGLERDIPAAERKSYLGRIASRGSTEHIYKAFLAGLGQEEQELLGQAFDRRYEAQKAKYESDMYQSESALSVPMFMELKRTYMRDSVAYAFVLLRDGHVQNETAQLGFASIIYADGLKEHAGELMDKGSLGIQARQVLRYKRHGNENVA